MKTLLTLVFMLIAGTPIAAAAPEIIPGCQGEGCDCFQAYRSATPTTTPKRHDIPTIRAFALYKDRSRTSQSLGNFQPGTKARPLKQELAIDVSGEYIVELVQDTKLPLAKGDKLDTIINEGEGFVRARKNGKWVGFDGESVKLKVVKPSVISQWMSVAVNGITGFTQDQPFEMCLE